MHVRRLSSIIQRHNINGKVFPTLNFCGIFCICSVITVGVLGKVVAGIAFFFLTILWFGIGEKAREALRAFWFDELPLLKFHAVFVLLEIGILFFLIKFVFVGESVKKNK